MAGIGGTTAQVIPFAPRARASAVREAGAGGVVAMPARPAPTPSLVEYGSGWYHAAAIDADKGEREPGGNPRP